MKKLTVLVDMDDTIEQLLAAWVRLANRRFGADVQIEQIADWDVSKAFENATHDEVYALLQEPALYEQVEPIEDAPQYLKRLIDDGHDVYIVTSSPYQVMHVKVETILKRYFPYIDWEHVILTYNKSLIRGDVLVDDGVHNLVGFPGARILFSAPHNRAFDADAAGMLRVDTWPQAYAAICLLSEGNETSE